MIPALDLDEVGVAYGMSLTLENVDGMVAPGEAVALVGPNGAGKSTLIKAILGLVPLTSGRLAVFGASPVKARKKVAYVPQADTLDPEFPISVDQVVSMGRYREFGWSRGRNAGDKDAAARALEQVGMADRARCRFHALSGGQRQRVLLARAIAAEPSLLLLDTPLDGADAAGGQVLLKAIAALKGAGVAVVVATQDLRLASVACEQVCLLNRCQYGFGPTEAMLTPDRLRAVYDERAPTAVEFG